MVIDMSDPSRTTQRNQAASSVDPFASASELAAAIRSRLISSRELLELYLGRVERFNPALNAIVTLDADQARAGADAADAAIARGDHLGPLHGVPITIKDSIATAGMRTTSGATMLAGYVPERDADAVARLRAAGAIVFGKTNLPEFAGDAQSFNELFGTTNNPWDLERTPGGSSGGAAAAVAAGLTGFEVGSDIGGSLRIPAHFCGVYTIKPTWGTVSIAGHIPPPPDACSAVDVLVLGPLARSAGDLDLILTIIAGPDAAAETAWRLELPPPRADLLPGYRIAACLAEPYSPVDDDTAAIYERMIEDLAAAGAHVTAVAIPVSLAEMHDLAQRLVQGSMSPWLPDEAYQSLVTRAATAAPDDDRPPVRWARNITQPARELKKAEYQRDRMKANWAEFFTRYDALLCPVMPTPAYRHDHNPDVDARRIAFNDTTIPYGDQFAWLQAIGVVHLPAVVAPVGRTASGLPVGIQIVGPHLEDRTPIDVARHVERITGGFRAPPGFAADSIAPESDGAATNM
jgi:amidase